MEEKIKLEFLKKQEGMAGTNDTFQITVATGRNGINQSFRNLSILPSTAKELLRLLKQKLEVK